jgi:hypothetical protein
MNIEAGLGRAARVDSTANSGGALLNSFLYRNDSLLILWSDSLK